MPGLVPGIHVFGHERSKTWMAGTSPAMMDYVAVSLFHTGRARFIIFVDRIFTTSLQRAFTNTIDASAQIIAPACVCRARNAG